MQLAVVQLGRLREPHVVALRDEYVHRFRAFGRLAVAERRRDRFAWREDDGHRVVLDDRGETHDSPGLARELAAWQRRWGRVTFLVGDAEGIPDRLRTGAHRALSLGPLVLPHRLAHLVLVEQLYRAGSILAGHPYHRG